MRLLGRAVADTQQGTVSQSVVCEVATCQDIRYPEVFEHARADRSRVGSFTHEIAILTS